MYKRYYLAWFSIVIFYFFQYILRVTPSVIIHDIRADLMLTAHQFSLMSAFTLYSYSLLQIPLGLAVDKYGVRKVVLPCILSCAIGAILFSVSKNIYLSYFSRVLIGIGAAPSFMCAVKVAMDYLPSGQKGLFVGSTLTFGTFGAIFSQTIFAHLVEKTESWRAASLITFIPIAFVAMICCLLSIPKRSKNEANESAQPMSLAILKDYRIYLYSLMAVGLYTPLSILADNWGPYYLMAKYGYNRLEASGVTSMMYSGLAIGSLIVVWLAEKYHKFNLSIKIAFFLLIILFYVFLKIDISKSSLLSLLFVLGFLAGTVMVSFGAVSLFTPAKNSGLVIGIINTLNMLGGGLYQHYVGYYLDDNWKGQLDANGLRIYGLEELTTALSTLLWLFVICFCFSLLLKNKEYNTRQQ